MNFVHLQTCSQRLKKKEPLFLHSISVCTNVLLIVSTLTSPRFLLLLLLCSNILTIKAPKLAQFTRTLSYCDWCWTIFGVTALLHNGTAGLCGDDDLDWLAFSLLIFLDYTQRPVLPRKKAGKSLPCRVRFLKLLIVLGWESTS